MLSVFFVFFSRGMWDSAPALFFYMFSRFLRYVWARDMHDTIGIFFDNWSIFARYAKPRDIRYLSAPRFARK